MASENEMTVAQLDLKLDAVLADSQRKTDIKLELIHERIDNLETSRSFSKKSRRKMSLVIQMRTPNLKIGNKG